MSTIAQWFAVGFAFGAGVIVGATAMWMAVDWVYRKLGDPK